MITSEGLVARRIFTGRRSSRRSRTLILVVGVLATSGISNPRDLDRGPCDALPEIAPGTVEHHPMTALRLGELIQNVDETAVQQGSRWQFQVGGQTANMIYDERADRMRIVIPIQEASDISAEQLTRMMQANFDSALDARYAVGNGLLWGTFIHPLSTLSDEQFLVGLAQTVNVVVSFGEGYSSGLFMFNGGDSAEIEQRRLIDELKQKI